MTESNDKQEQTPQADDQLKEDQQSHGDQQRRSKKDGHATQLGSGQDQTSQRNRKGGGAQR